MPFVFNEPLKCTVLSFIITHSEIKVIQVLRAMKIKKLNRLIVGCAVILLFATVSLRAQSVVVNKYFNSGTTADIVELLVIENNLDMRGMYIKDFSSNMANDGGGKYQFSTDALWSSVPSGTLIVLRNNNSAADVTVGGGDYNLDVGLQNATYFTNAGGTFDLATTDFVLIKTAASGAAGVTGIIHGLAGGTAGAQFTAASAPKLITAGTSGTNQFVYANNSTQSLADFNGTDATGSATGLTFGAGNNANNTAYINALRSPTAANVTISGRVMNSDGRAIARAQIRFNDMNGNPRTAVTNQFGYFTFEQVEAAQTYVFQASAKGYSFAPQVISVNDDLTNLTFVSIE